MAPYIATVYFEGPRSTWSRKIDESEVIYRAPAPFLWMARTLAKRYAGNTGRCGYVISHGDLIVEVVAAPQSAYMPA